MESLTTEALDQRGLTEAQYLREYDASRYPHPSVAVDTLIFTVTLDEPENYRKLSAKCLSVLLVKRKGHPFMAKWALPGGFVEIGESLDEAARRELREEAGVDGIYMEQLYTWGDVQRDPRTRVIGCSYMALVDSSAMQIEAGSDAADARWFRLSTSPVADHTEVLDNGFRRTEDYRISLESGDARLSAIIRVNQLIDGNAVFVSREIVEQSGLAFDHAKIIGYGLERLRNKVEYTAVAFSLMPPLFTLTDLQHVYEIILGRPLAKAHFRRKIAPMVLETGNVQRDVGHRPSRMYRFNPDWLAKGL